MKQRKNGFTLIELLAVIIILAAIALIVAPLVLDIIKEQQMKTFKESINGILRSSRLEIVNSGLKFPATFTYSDGKLLSPMGKELKVTGKIPEGTGSVIYNSEDDIILGITDQTWCGTYNKTSKEVEVNEFTGECSGKIEYNLTSTDPMYDCFSFEASTGTLTGYTCEQTDIVIPTKVDGVNVIKLENNFNNCYISSYCGIRLTSVDFSKSYYLTEIGDDAFWFNNLSTVIMPEGVTRIGERAFLSNQLTNIMIPHGVTEIGRQAFSGNLLTNVTISPLVESIGDQAFFDNQLTSVIIPNSVTTMGLGVFWLNELTSVTIQGKNSSTDFTSYPTSSPFEWADGYSDSNIIWNG